MPRDTDPLFAPLADDLNRLRDEIGGLAAAHWQLAQLELRAALLDARRLAIGAGIAGLLGLVALPVLVVAASEALDGQAGVSRLGWLAIFGSLLLIAGVAVGWLAWRRFRAQFVGLEETLEEMHEAVAWLQGWADAARAERPAPGA